MNSLKSIFFRYSFFVFAKYFFILTRTALLIVSFSWLTNYEFSTLAITISFIEILRALFDAGAEPIIYSKLSSINKNLKISIKKIIKFRVLLSIFLVIILATIFISIGKSDYWPLYFLPLILTIQSTSAAFIQRDKIYKKLFFPILFTIPFSILLVIIAYVYKISSTKLFFIMILPELFVMIIMTVISYKYWLQIFLSTPLNRSFFLRIYPFILPSALLNFIVMIYSRLDLTLVYPLLGVSFQSTYSVAMRISDVILSILIIFSMAFLAELGSKTNSQAKSIITKFYYYLTLKNLTFFMLITILLGIIIKFFMDYFMFFNNEINLLVFFFFILIPIKITNSLISSCIQRLSKFHFIMLASLRVLFCIFIFGIPLSYVLGLKGVIISIGIAEIFNLFFQKKKLHDLLNLNYAK